MQIRWPRPSLAAVPLLGALLAAALPGVVAAHVELRSSSPSAGEQLDAAPREVVLEFDGELDPDRSRFSVAAPDGSRAGTGTLDLTVAERNVLRGPVTVEAPGTYTVTWVAIGLDGHAAEGSLSFGYGDAASAAASPATEAAPDTAMATPAAPDRSALGWTLLLAGAIAVGLHIARRGARS